MTRTSSRTMTREDVTSTALTWLLRGAYDQPIRVIGFGIQATRTAEGGRRFMHIRRLPGLAVAVAVFLSGAQAAAQRANSNQTPAKTQPDPDTIALVQLVDAAIVAAPTVQVGDTTKGEIALKWDSSHFIKGQNGVYIPFTLTFDPASIRTSDVGIYVRAIEKDRLPLVGAALAPPAAPAAGSKQPPPSPSIPPKYAWDNVTFLPKPADGRITRAIALPAGDY